jgi:hypothetical protein
VALFAVRGLLRGTVGQFFSLFGLLVGVWGAGWVANWLAHRWQDARPVLVFGGLRWLVAVLAGLAIATLFQWWGDLLGKAVKASPAGFFDRLGGMVLGAGVGVMVASITMLGALLTTWPPAVGDTAARSRFSVPLMTAGAKVCGIDHRFFPGSGWLEQKFLAARRRAQTQSPQS